MAKSRIVFFGYCMSILMAKRAHLLCNNSPILKEKYEIINWTHGLQHYEKEFFFTDNEGCVLFCSDKKKFPQRHQTDVLSYDQSNESFFKVGHGYGLPRFHIPLKHEPGVEYYYVFASPLTEYGRILKTFHWLIAQRQTISSAMLCDIISCHYAHMLQFIERLHALPIKLIIIEGNRHLPIDTDAYLFNKLTDMSREILRKKIHASGFEILSLPEGLHDKYGFTKEKFRKDDNPRHPNNDYFEVLSNYLFDYISGLPEDWKSHTPVKVSVERSCHADLAGLRMLLDLRDDALRNVKRQLQAMGN